MEPLLLHGHHEHTIKNYVGLTLTQPPGAELDPGEGFEGPFCSQAVMLTSKHLDESSAYKLF